MFCLHVFLFFFFFNDTATTEIYTLSLHDALPISSLESRGRAGEGDLVARGRRAPRLLPSGDLQPVRGRDRKSTRLNSSHGYISYAVFCLKKKKKQRQRHVDSEVSRQDRDLCTHES